MYNIIYLYDISVNVITARNNNLPLTSYRPALWTVVLVIHMLLLWIMQILTMADALL